MMMKASLLVTMYRACGCTFGPDWGSSCCRGRRHAVAVLRAWLRHRCVRSAAAYRCEKLAAGDHCDELPWRRRRAEPADRGRRGGCESGEGISQRRTGRDDHRKHRVQHVGPDGALDAQRLGACLYPPDPVADRVRGYAQVGADGSVTLATGAWPAAPVRRG